MKSNVAAFSSSSLSIIAFKLESVEYTQSGLLRTNILTQYDTDIAHRRRKWKEEVCDRR